MLAKDYEANLDYAAAFVYLNNIHKIRIIFKKDHKIKDVNAKNLYMSFLLNRNKEGSFLVPFLFIFLSS